MGRLNSLVVFATYDSIIPLKIEFLQREVFKFDCCDYHCEDEFFEIFSIDVLLGIQDCVHVEPNNSNA